MRIVPIHKTHYRQTNFTCQHCGLEFRTWKMDSRGRSQCPDCGFWAYKDNSKEGKKYKQIIDLLADDRVREQYSWEERLEFAWELFKEHYRIPKSELEGVRE